MPFATRVWFAWVCFFRTLFDGDFAARAFLVKDALPALPPPEKPARAAVSPPSTKPPQEPTEPSPSPQSASQPAPESPPPPLTQTDVTPALTLLALLQREGRFIDFIEQDVTTFSDADIGAAARVVHEGCRKALHQSSKITALRTEEEGTTVTITENETKADVKLLGNLTGKPPYRGKLEHRGWRVKDLVLPVPTKHNDASVVAPAEVSL